MLFNLIVAICRNNGIGFKGNMPWHIKNDLQYFSKLTKGNGNNAVVMGKNTWNSLPQKQLGLIGRDNFIFTHEMHSINMITSDKKMIKTFASYEEFDTFIQTHKTPEENDINDINDNKPEKEIWIIGGAQIYTTFMEKNIIDKCYVTYIDKEFECDTFFPLLNPTVWHETEFRREYNTQYECEIFYLVYERSKIDL